MRTRFRKQRRLRPCLLGVARSMGKWRAQDDFQLIQSIIQLNSLADVLKLTKFTRRFSLKELKERWYAILYDAPISKMIYNNIKKLHPDDVLRLKRLAPFSDKENKLLIEIDSDTQVEHLFENLLMNNRPVFHDSRTSYSLEDQWNLLKDLRLLSDRAGTRDKMEIKSGNDNLDFSFNELESRINDKLIQETVRLNTEAENASMLKSYQSLLQEIKRSEADVFLWQVLADKITDRKNAFADVETLAVLFCEKIEFIMNKKEVSIGRSSSNSKVDIDLSTIYKADKTMSRKQCVICHVKSDLFFLFNRGRMPVFVDGNPVLINERSQLNDKSLIEIGDVAMLFLVNYNIISNSD